LAGVFPFAGKASHPLRGLASHFPVAALLGLGSASSQHSIVEEVDVVVREELVRLHPDPCSAHLALSVVDVCCSRSSDLRKGLVFILPDPRQGPILVCTSSLFSDSCKLLLKL